MQMVFSSDPLASGMPSCSPCQSRRRATEQRETLQTAGQHRPDEGSGLEHEDQEPPNELNHPTKDDLPSEIPSSDIAPRELEECLRQHQQDRGPNRSSDDPRDSA
jgi:hypothetical protein